MTTLDEIGGYRIKGLFSSSFFYFEQNQTKQIDARKDGKAHKSKIKFS